MVETVGRKDLAFHHPKVGGYVGASRFVDDDGMSDRIETVFVCPRVDGREIKVIDDFTVLDHVIQLDGIRAAPEERVSWLEPGHEFERVDKSMHALFLLLEACPLAFPHDNHVVALRKQGILFEDAGFLHVTHGLVAHLVPHLVAVGKTLGAPVPKAAVEFVDDVGVGIVPIHVIRFGAPKDQMFPAFVGVTNVHVGFSVEVRQPLQGREGMGLALGVPSTDGF